MKWVPSQLGAEPKKLAVLGGLALVLVVVYFINRNPDVPQQPAPVRTAVTGPAPIKTFPARPASKSSSPMPPRRNAGTRQGDTAIQDFKPTLKLPEGADVSRIDPSLKLDLMAQLQQLPMEGGERSLFEFGAPPKPKTPTPAVAPVKPQSPPTPKPGATPATPVTPPKPAPPPIPLKFYGYVGESQGPSKRAFFLDGEDIVVAGENDVIRSRYKVVRIGVNSAIVEDTATKNQQTLPLIEELQG
jgi:hypothetical protein